MSKIPRLVLAGTSSGVGKTSISCGLIYALKHSGRTVQPFKVGPDYIDAGHLSAVAGCKARNLDLWIMNKNSMVNSFVQNSTRNVSVIEGVMGYYDGASGKSDHASTHHVGSVLDAPAILIVDASKTSRSVAAMVLGYVKFHKNSRIRGIILNRLGSKRHESMCREALASVKIPIVGCIMRNDALVVESRHLGLVTAHESDNKKNTMQKAAKKISQNLDIRAILRICNSAPSLQRTSPSKPSSVRSTIAVALDDSFNFYYEDNMDSLRRAGARIKFFSPIKDNNIPKCDGIYIGGGFPEIQAAKLAKNTPMKKAIKKFAESGRPIYAECGGLMYLSDGVRHGGKNFKMVGLIMGEAVMTGKPTLNYTEFNASKCLAFNAGSAVHGHEFHYSAMRGLAKDAKFAYRLTKGIGMKGGRDGLVEYGSLASYCHLYFSDKMAKNMVDASVAASRR